MTEDKLSLRKYAAVIAILIVLVMTVLDVTLVNVALPVMAEKFGVSDPYAVWIVTIYQLAITMLLPLSSAGDLFSYRRNRCRHIHIGIRAMRRVRQFYNDTHIAHPAGRWCRVCDECRHRPYTPNISASHTRQRIGT